MDESYLQTEVLNEATRNNGSYLPRRSRGRSNGAFSDIREGGCVLSDSSDGARHARPPPGACCARSDLPQLRWGR